MGAKGTRHKTPTTQALNSKDIGTTVVVTTLVHEVGEIMARVALDRNREVVGVLLPSMDSTEYPF